MTLCLRRETLSGTCHAFTFDKARSEFLVKNLGEGTIYVAFEENATEARAIKIPSKYGQICSCSNVEGTTGMVSSTIYITGTGEVEVQQL